MIIVELAGTPLGKGRPRFMRATGHAYTPAKTRNFESNLLLAAQDVMAGRPPIEGPLYVRVVAHFPVPQSWSKKKRASALLGELWPTTRPDWENVAKMLDAFNGVVWVDDAQVAEGLIIKRYSDRPRLRVEVSELRVEK
jgi:Holliday junction resolvase RusA-like endonuclease